MASSLSGTKILIIDDDPVILKALSLDLEHKGYDVFTAVDAPEAFTIVRQQGPDLILLDIFFPPDAFQTGNTWDAFLIMQWLQHMGEPRDMHIPVIIISGAEPEEFRNRCLAAGAMAYLQKPVKMLELLNAIQQIHQLRVSEVPLELATVSNFERMRP